MQLGSTSKSGSDLGASQANSMCRSGASPSNGSSSSASQGTRDGMSESPEEVISSHNKATLDMQIACLNWLHVTLDMRTTLDVTIQKKIPHREQL